MNITGHKLRQSINQAELHKSVIAGRFEDAKMAFPGETKEPLVSIADQFMAIDVQIAKLQDLQARYNLRVEVSLEAGANGAPERFSLREAVARLGGAGRMEKLWRSVATPKGERHSYRDDTRDPSMLIATSTITSEASLVCARAASRYAGDLRAAIASANNTEIDVEELLDIGTDVSWLSV